MKLSIAAATALPLLASGYSMGGFNSFGRPVIVTNGPCGPARAACAPSNADRAFDNLKKEIDSSSPQARRRRGGMSMTKEEAARQREWLNRAFGLATEAAAAAAGVDVKEGNEALRQQQEWLGRAFGVDFDDSSTTTVPRYQVNDSDESFQVAMDVPGVKQSDIDITMEENVLTIAGEREMGMGKVTRKTSFSKSFTLTGEVEADKITAQLNNGVLKVTCPKNIPEPNVKKITVMQVEDTAEDEPVERTDGAAIDADVSAAEENDGDAEKDDADADTDETAA